MSFVFCIFTDFISVIEAEIGGAVDATETVGRFASVRAQIGGCDVEQSQRMSRC